MDSPEKIESDQATEVHIWVIRAGLGVRIWGIADMNS
jgi:hypothetical protein